MACCCSQALSQLTRGTKQTKLKLHLQKMLILRKGFFFFFFKGVSHTFCLACGSIKSQMNNLTSTQKAVAACTPSLGLLKIKCEIARVNNTKPLLTHCFNHVINPDEVALSPLPAIQDFSPRQGLQRKHTFGLAIIRLNVKKLIHKTVFAFTVRRSINRFNTGENSIELVKIIQQQSTLYFAILPSHI